MSDVPSLPDWPPEAARALGELIDNMLQESLLSGQTELARKSCASTTTVSALINAARPTSWVIVRSIAAAIDDSEEWLDRVQKQWRLADLAWREPRQNTKDHPAVDLPTQDYLIRWRHPRLGILEFTDQQTAVAFFKEIGGLDGKP